MASPAGLIHREDALETIQKSSLAPAGTQAS